MLKVLGRATSANVQRVMWTIAELGLECEQVDIGGAYGGNDTPDVPRQEPARAGPHDRDGRRPA